MSYKIFAERFVLPFLLMIMGAYLVVANPLHFGFMVRIVGIIVIFTIAYAISWFVGRSQPSRKVTSPKSTAEWRRHRSVVFHTVFLIIVTVSIFYIIRTSTCARLSVPDHNPFFNAHPLVSLLKDPPQSVRRNPDGMERIFVRTSPSEIKKEISGHTDQQVQTIVARYLEKWIAFTGYIADIKDESGTRWTKPEVVVLLKTDIFHELGIAAMFDSVQWHDKLSLLNDGDNVNVACKINEIDSFKITMKECELF